MSAYSYYTQVELEEGFKLVSKFRPQLAELMLEANTHIKDGSYFNISARPVYSNKNRWMPWRDADWQIVGVRHVELLYGDITKSSEMQIVFAHHESYLLGFIQGCEMAKYRFLEHAWKNFIVHLNEVDGLQTKAFLGSTDRYYKIFLEANSNNTDEC